MKKSTSHFTFEVKRSRLPSQKASTFQRFILDPKPTEAAPRHEPRVADGNSSAVSERALPERRVLPSLVENIVPQELIAPRPKKRRVIKPRPVVEAEAVTESRPEVASEPIAIEEAVVVRPAAILASSKRQRVMPKTVADLPRGQKWKRRLPRAAW